MALPKKHYYRLSEVALRWKKDEEDILQWAETGDLKLAFHSDPRTVGIIKLNPDEPAGDWPYYLYYYYIGSSFLYVDKLNISKVLKGDPDLAHIATPATPGLDDLLADPPNFIEPARPGIVKLVQKIDFRESLFMIDEDGDPIGTGVPYLTIDVTLPPKITKDVLVVMTDDLERLEEEYPELKSGKKTNGTVKKVDRTNLRIIGAIVEILTNEKENMFKSEAALIDKIIDEGYGDLHGISKRTLEDRFKQSKDVLYSKVT